MSAATSTRPPLPDLPCPYVWCAECGPWEHDGPAGWMRSHRFEASDVLDVYGVEYVNTKHDVLEPSIEVNAYIIDDAEGDVVTELRRLIGELETTAARIESGTSR